MRRICIVGNSHVGSVKLGLDLARAQGTISDIEADIFATYRESLTDCQITGGKMRPLTDEVEKMFEWCSGGRSEITLNDYDDIFFVAGVSPYFLMRYVHVQQGIISPTSRTVVREFVRGWAGGWAYKMVDALARASSSARVHFVGEPFQSDAAPFGRGITSALMADDGLMVARIARIKQLVTGCLTELSPIVATIFHPPPICLEQFGLFTKDEYCRNSSGLGPRGRKHVDTDFHHMNGLYGRLLIDLLLSSQGSGNDAGWARPASSLRTC